MPYIYILQNEKGRYYIGSTINLEKRLKQHLQGDTYSTKRMGTLKLVFQQEYITSKEARQIEYKLKKLKRHDYIANIVKDGFIKIKP